MFSRGVDMRRHAGLAAAQTADVVLRSNDTFSNRWPSDHDVHDDRAGKGDRLDIRGGHTGRPSQKGSRAAGALRRPETTRRSRSRRDTTHSQLRGTTYALASRSCTSSGATRGCIPTWVSEQTSCAASHCSSDGRSRGPSLCRTGILPSISPQSASARRPSSRRRS